jgi:hypothetical protein
MGVRAHRMWQSVSSPSCVCACVPRPWFINTANGGGDLSAPPEVGQVQASPTYYKLQPPLAVIREHDLCPGLTRVGKGSK